MNQPSTPTGTIVTGTNFTYSATSGALKGVILNVGATGTTSVAAYDNALGDTSGKVLFQASAVLASNYPTLASDFCDGIIFNKGLTIVVTGNGSCNAYFCAGG